MTKILIVNPNTTVSMTETIGAAARAVAAPGTEISAVTSAMGPVSIEGYYDEAFAVPGLIQALMNAPDADAGDHRLFRRHRPRRRANRGALPGGRHLRGGAGDRGPDRKTHRRRDHAAALDRAAARNWCAAMVLRNGPRSPPATSRCSISKSPARVRRRNSKPRSRARSTRAPKRSCWAARAWPISRRNCRKNSACPSSTASRPR